MSLEPGVLTSEGLMNHTERKEENVGIPGADKLW